MISSWKCPFDFDSVTTILVWWPALLARSEAMPETNRVRSAHRSSPLSHFSAQFPVDVWVGPRGGSAELPLGVSQAPVVRGSFRLRVAPPVSPCSRISLYVIYGQKPGILQAQTEKILLTPDSSNLPLSARATETFLLTRKSGGVHCLRRKHGRAISAGNRKRQNVRSQG